MSASLVGSEMCIRDRGWAGPNSFHLVQPRFARPGWAAPGWAGLGQAVGAVSYTHLTLPTICSV
eukprot:13941173-Alexandrium_andersonii.AAC.1